MEYNNDIVLTPGAVVAALAGSPLHEGDAAGPDWADVGGAALPLER